MQYINAGHNKNNAKQIKVIKIIKIIYLLFTVNVFFGKKLHQPFSGISELFNFGIFMNNAISL